MTKRKLSIIGPLIAISAIAFFVPYSFDPLCRRAMSVGMLPCLLRNGGLTIARWVPLGFAILLALASSNRGRRRQSGCNIWQQVGEAQKAKR
jgi:hypothetical protein